MRPVSPSSRTAPRGSSLIIALCATVPLMVAGGTMPLAVTHGRRANETMVAITQARDVAASGAQDALARLAVDPGFRSTYTLALGGPIAQITVTAWEDEGSTTTPTAWSTTTPRRSSSRSS